MINESAFKLKKNGEPCSRCVCRHPEKIENYDKAISDTLQTWEVHHRREDTFSLKELKERGEYYDVSPEELIFLTPTEHSKIDSMHKRRGEATKGKFINRKDQSKKVLCVETNETFESAHEVQRKTGISKGNISAVCLGSRKTAGGYHWRYI